MIISVLYYASGVFRSITGIIDSVIFLLTWQLISDVHSGPHHSLPTTWHGTCKHLHSRQAVLLNASSARSRQSGSGERKHCTENRKYIAAVAKKITNYYRSNGYFHYAMFSHSRKKHIMHVYKILIHCTTSLGSANGDTSGLRLLLFWFRKSFT